MSNLSETDFDLEKLFLPAWAQEAPSINKYSRFEGRDSDMRPDRGDRGGHRPGGPRRDGPGGGRDQNRSPRGDNRGAGPRRDGPGGGNRGPRRDFRDSRDPRDERREAPVPLPEIQVNLMPDEKGVDSISRQIKMTGRAYPLFEIAQMILQKPERQQVRFDVVKREGKVVQPMFLCALDDTLWLGEAEAVAHILTKHFDTFYQTEKIPTEPPKGVYTFVAQCGISGVILGPPNYHDYQNQLRRLHAERFSRMPFEAFKARVKIVKDEAVVGKWKEEQSFKTEFNCLNVPEPKKLASREEVEKHFREVHLGSIIKEVEFHSVSGPASRLITSGPLQRLLRHAWEEQKRFPIKVVTVLSQQFASRGLQFFKVNKTVTHVSVARPHFLDVVATPVSDGAQRIVDFINATPKCTRRALFNALAPTPAAAPTPQPPTEGAAPESTPAQAPAPTPEQSALISDLHWLIHQGHVIEFANGIMETAKRPAPKPIKPPPAKPVAGAAVTSATPVVATEEIAEHSTSEALPGLPDTSTASAEVPGDVAPASSETAPPVM
ncbi:MAG: hypothetical protein H7X97_06080 [Opitutaceae bacterium]|nr:hypothetical protein [Verrucomicrobiales bacterium]